MKPAGALAFVSFLSYKSDNVKRANLWLYRLMWTNNTLQTASRHVGATYRQYDERLDSKNMLIWPVFSTWTHRTVQIFVHFHQLFAPGVLGSITRSVATFFSFSNFWWGSTFKIFFVLNNFIFMVRYSTFRVCTVFYILDLNNFLEHAPPLKKFSPALNFL